ncbi:MAG TPA: hypothetical protein VFS43_28160 [Polyangiaceae bacterium]|nr:hypothetical protein [Polyangiaceae bacterium]
MGLRAGAAALLLLSGGLVGCPQPQIIDAANAYGKTTADAVAVAGSEPETVYTVCKKRAYLAYLNDRLAHEKLGAGLGPPYEEFFNQAIAVQADPSSRRPALSYQQYCNALRDAGKPFADAVAVLSRYGSALEALSGDAAVTIGDDVALISTNAGGFVAAATGNEVGAAGAAVASALKAFAELLVKERVAADLEAYVVAADPHVQRLLAAMARYDRAVKQEVANQRNDIRASINAIEGLYGLATNGPAPAPAPTPLAPAPPPAAAPPASAAPSAAKPAKVSPEVAALRDELERVKQALERERADRRASAQLRRDINALKPALFFELASSFEEQARGVEAEYAKYEGLLQKWQTAHAQLVKVAQTDARNDLAALRGTVGDLAARLKELQVIIEGNKK